MFDILLNGQVVAVVIPQLVKIFVKSLVDMLPEQMHIETKPHVDEKPAEELKKESK